MKEFILQHPFQIILLLIILTLILISIFKKKWSEKIFLGFTFALMFLTYFTIFAITAIILKIFGKRLLTPFKKKESGYWVDYHKLEHTIDKARKQG